MVMAFPKENSVLRRFSSLPPPTPPMENADFSFRVVSPSLIVAVQLLVKMTLATQKIRDRKGTPKNLYDKDFAELSGEFSGAICLKTLALLGNDQ